MRTYRLHFIRHGLTDGNTEGKYIGITDLSLSEDGADELAAIFDRDEVPQTSLIFSSPLKRCLETCEILYPNRKPILIPELGEFNFGEFENKTVFELESDPRYIEWTSGRAGAPGGETSEEFTSRLALGLNKVVRQMMELGVFEASVVTHGGVIMTLFAQCALPQRRAVEWSSPTGGGYTALITPSLYGRSGVIEIIDTVPSTAVPCNENCLDEPEEDEFE